MDIDAELLDDVHDNSLANQLEAEKRRKLREFKEREMARLDTIKRKMTRKAIRQESYDDVPKRADVEQRAHHNAEIVDASVRQAQRKAER